MSNKVCIVGLGYVGIPVAAKFAEAGFDVVGIDIIKEKIEKINQGIFPLKGEEPGMEKLVESAVRMGKLKASLDYAECKDADFIVVSIQTPMKENKPDYSFLRNALESIGKNISKGCTISIESTISPNTIKKLAVPVLEKKSGMKAGDDFYLVHCPERVKPRKLLEHLETLSRAIGGVNRKSGKKAKEFYEKIVKGDLDVTDALTAELVKTVENSYWDNQIAFANEIGVACEKLGVDFFELRKLVNKSPHRNMLMAGAGVGGHCIPKDSRLLMHSLGEHRLKLIEAARELNDSMPFHVVDLIKNVVENGSKICILGAAYIRDTDDTRNSPSLIIAEELKKIGFDVQVYDPYVNEYDNNMEEKIRGSDCLVLATGHTKFKELNTKEKLSEIKELMRNPVIVDGRNLFDKKLCEEIGFVYKGIGKG